MKYKYNNKAKDHLNFNENEYNINSEDVFQRSEYMNNEIIKKHRKEHKIWEAKGKRKRWCTYIPDENSKRGIKLLAKNTEEELYVALIDYYENKNQITLKDLYGKWQKHKSLYTKSTSYFQRMDCDWKRFYLTTDIVNIPIKKLTLFKLEEWALGAIKEYELTKKTYMTMQTILRQCLDYAVKAGYIETNVFQKIKIPPKLFKAPSKKEDNTQVFLIDEKPLIINAALDDFNKTNNPISLIIPFLFETGLRVGEVTAIKFSDLYDDKPYIHICRSEIKTFEWNEEKDKFTQSGYEVVPHTKSKAGVRDVYLTEIATSIIARLKKWQIDFLTPSQNKDGYIALMPDGEKAHAKDIQNKLRMYCRHLNIPQRSVHKIRKTYISTLIDSGDISINTIKKMVGHESARTTYQSYVYSRQNTKQEEECIEKALKKG